MSTIKLATPDDPVVASSALVPVSSPVPDRRRHDCGCRLPADSGDRGSVFRAGQLFNLPLRAKEIPP